MNLKNYLAGLNFFQIYLEKPIGNSLDGLFTEDELSKIDKNKIVRVKNGDGVLNPENWEQNKETFFAQRMGKYESYYTVKEKINFELEDLENLNTTNKIHKVLKKRYKDYLLKKQEEQQDAPAQKPLPKQFENFTIREEIKPFVAEIYNTFKNVESKQMAILVFVLHADNIIPYLRRNQKTGRKALMKCFNPSINETGVKHYFDAGGKTGNELQLDAAKSHYVSLYEIDVVRKALNEILSSKTH